MKKRAFLDTNLFVYADDKRDKRKQAKATELIQELHRSGLAVVSVQVMQEYFNAATRKLGVDASIAQRKIELMAGMNVVRIEAAEVITAIELHRLSRISFWDALILHAARLGGAEVLYTEDMQDGWRLGKLKVVNPFRDGSAG
jgi:predicted nucleic acid-binding protein